MFLLISRDCLSTHGYHTCRMITSFQVESKMTYSKILNSNFTSDQSHVKTIQLVCSIFYTKNIYIHLCMKSNKHRYIQIAVNRAIGIIALFFNMIRGPNKH